MRPVVSHAGSDSGRVVVVGGGAAGMMAAIAAAGEGAHTVLLEKTARLGLKIRISGGGRCNVTNDLDDPVELAKYFPGNGRFLIDAFRHFRKQDLLELLAQHGVKTKVEAPYGKVFPVSDRSADILDALQAEMHDRGVEIRISTPITGLHIENGRAAGVVAASGGIIRAKAIVLCTGGKSMPKSGSTGDGYQMAQAVGHEVRETFPSLVPLRVPGTKDLAGIALRDVEGTVLVDGKVADRKWRGDMLFTHFGLSGPIVLQLSRAAADGLRRHLPVELKIDLKPDSTAEELDRDLVRRFAASPKSLLASLLPDDMPKRVVPHFLEAAGVEGGKKVSEVSRGERQRLVETLRGWRFPVSGWHSFDAAEVTAGGVDVQGVDPRTFASKLVPGLFFAGEILDVDGYVGGFNLQAAWSSGFAAGKAAARFARS